MNNKDPEIGQYIKMIASDNIYEITDIQACEYPKVWIVVKSIKFDHHHGTYLPIGGLSLLQYRQHTTNVSFKEIVEIANEV